MKLTKMCILNKITSLLKEQRKSQKALCEYLGIKQQAFTNWKNGDNDSFMKYLPQIADFFGVTVDFLISDQQKKSTAEVDPYDDSIPFEDRMEAFVSVMSDEEKKELENYIKFIISKKNG